MTPNILTSAYTSPDLYPEESFPEKLQQHNVRKFWKVGQKVNMWLAGSVMKEAYVGKYHYYSDISLSLNK